MSAIPESFCRNDIAGILCQRTVFRIVDDHGVSDHRKGLDLTEGIDSSGIQIRDVDHVALLHDGVTVVGCIESDAVDHGILVEVGCRDRYVAEHTIDIHHLKVHHLDVFFLDQFHNVTGCF